MINITELNFETPKGKERAVVCFADELDFDLEKDTGKVLCKEELERFNSFLSTKRQRGFLLGRLCAKKALSAYTGEVEFTKINIKNGIFDHPCIQELELKENISVGISHSDGFAAAVAFPEMLPLSLDIENINPKRSKTIFEQLTPKEKELTASLSGFPEDHTLTMMWTMKEGLAKVLKIGLTTPLSVLEVKEIQKNSEFLSGSFTNFSQYKTVTCCSDAVAFSLIFPRLSTIDDTLTTNKLIENLRKLRRVKN